MGGHKPSILSITTEKYVEVLKDSATYSYYSWNPPCLGGPSSKELREDHISGSSVWQSDHVPDPWEELMLAVCRQAVNDYIHYYKFYKKSNSPFAYREMKRIENDYFRRNEATELVFEELLRRLRNHKGDLKYLRISNDRTVKNRRVKE